VCDKVGGLGGGVRVLASTICFARALYLFNVKLLSLAFRIRTKLRFESVQGIRPHPSTRFVKVLAVRAEQSDCDMKARKESGGSVRVAQLIE
jgi:hypothetical protein